MPNKATLPNHALLLANAHTVEKDNDGFDWDNTVVSQNYNELKVKIKKSAHPQPLIIQ